MTPSSPPSSNESGPTRVFDVGFSPLLAGVVAGFHGLAALLVAWQWQWSPTAVALATAGALVGSAVTVRQGLVPGRAGMPRRVQVSADGTWCLEAREDIRGVLHAAWVHPWLCRIVLVPLTGGRHRLWLARDALGDDAHWRLRRLLRGFR